MSVEALAILELLTYMSRLGILFKTIALLGDQKDVWFHFDFTLLA